MEHLTSLVAAAAISVASMASAQDMQVNDLRVSVSPDANVDTLWPGLEGDLQTVFDQKFAAYRNDDGFDIVVRIIEVSVDGSMIFTEEEEFNRLEGWIYVQPADQETIPFKVIVDAETGALYRDAEGIVQIPNTALFYVAMLNGFADLTLKSVLDLDL